MNSQTPLTPFMGKGRKPLAGVRVLDFCWAIAGTLGTRVLADFGAEVIKVESFSRLDRIREGGVRKEGDTSLEAASVFADCNSAKLSITLNLNTPEGIDLAKRLAKISDVVTNNFTGERMDRWGLGYSDLVKINPSVIMLSMPVMGTTGPLKRYGAYGNGVAALAGFNPLMGFPGRAPVGIGPLYPDFSSPFLGATAIFMALHYRNRTGKGQFIDLGQYQANVSLLDTEILDYTVNGVEAGPSANRSAHSCPHGVFPCEGEDNWCAVEVTSDGQWQTLCVLMQRPDLAADPRLQTLAGRKGQEDLVDEALKRWTAQRDRWDVMETLQRAGIAAGVVETLEDLLEHDTYMAREHFQQVKHPAGYDFTLQRLPIRIDGQPAVASPHPTIAEHNRYVYHDLLGLAEDEVNRLADAKVLW